MLGTNSSDGQGLRGMQRPEQGGYSKKKTGKGENAKWGAPTTTRASGDHQTDEWTGIITLKHKGHTSSVVKKRDGIANKRPGRKQEFATWGE